MAITLDFQSKDGSSILPICSIMPVRIKVVQCSLTASEEDRYLHRQQIISSSEARFHASLGLRSTQVRILTIRQKGWLLQKIKNQAVNLVVVGSNPALCILGKASSSVGRARTKTHPEFAPVVERQTRYTQDVDIEGSNPSWGTRIRVSLQESTALIKRRTDTKTDSNRFASKA